MSSPEDLERVDVERHSAFVNELARRYSADRSSADDLAQDTWLVALERPPKDTRALHGWFARVVRHLAIDRARQTSRRTRREQAAFFARAALADDGPAPSDDPAAVRRLLAALDRPYREVLELHYLRQRTVSEIARELGLPSETVRTRIRRGLSRLRSAFGREERKAPALWPFPFRWLRAARRADVPARAAVPGWATALAVGAAVAAAVVAVLHPWSGERADHAERAPVAAHDAEARTATALLEPSRSERTAAEEMSAASASARLDLVARHSDGTAAASLEVELSDGATSHGARLDAQGRARVADLVPGTWSVRAERGTRRTVHLVPGDNALELVLPRAVSVTGRLIDPNGAPVRDGEVFVSWPDRPDRPRATAPADALGEYALDDVDPSAWIGARAPGLAQPELVAAGSLAHGADGLLHADFHFAGAAPVLRGTVRAAGGAPVAGSLLTTAPRVSHTRLTGPGGVRAIPERTAWTTDAAGAFVLAGLAPDERVLIVSAEGFASRALDVASDASARPLEVELEPGAALRGRVVDVDGAGATGAEVELALAQPLPSLRARADALGRFAFEHVPAGAHALRARFVHAGRAFAGELELPARAPGEARLVLAPTDAIQGELVDEDGRVLAGWDVVLVSQLFLGLGDPGPLWIDGAGEARGTSDAQGRFALLREDDEPVTLAVYAPADAENPVHLVRELPHAGVQTRIVVPRSTRRFRAYGRVIDVAGNVPSDARVLLVGEGYRRPLQLYVDPESGAFAADRLLPGPYQWAVTRPGQRVTAFLKDELGASGDEDLGDLVLEELGRLELSLACDDPSLIADAEVELQGGHLTIASPLADPRDGIEFLAPQRVLFPPLTRFDYVVRVSGPRLATIERTVEILPGGTTTLELALAPGLPVLIQARWPRAGRPERLFLVVSREGSVVHRWPILRTTAELDEVTVGLEPGDYVAEFKSKDEGLVETKFSVGERNTPVVLAGPPGGASSTATGSDRSPGAKRETR